MTIFQYIARLMIISIGMMLVGCYALPSASDSGPVTAVSGAQRTQSATDIKRLRGNVSKESTVWRLGALEGLCSIQAGDGAQPPLIIDDVLLVVDALFHTSESALSESGIGVMHQLKRRLELYENVKRVELVGHADRRGSAAKNYQLAQDRAESVRQWLNNAMPGSLPMRVLSLGESKSKKRGPVSELTNDRRVDVRIIATGGRSASIDSTLCSVPSVAATGASGTAAQISKQQSILARQKNRHRLEPFNGDLPLSPGDQLRIAVAGDEDMDGVYELDLSGGIDIPLIGKQTVAGLTVPALQKVLADELVDKQIIRRSAVNVDAHVVEWSTVEVFVRGAVFNKGRVTINVVKPEILELAAMRRGGDSGQGRLLSFALMQAGGVRPDADLNNIQILRNGETHHINLSGLVLGELARDVPLVSGDEVIVPSTGLFNKELVAPTQVTPPGIRVFMSNATAPVYSNSLAHITKDEAALPYGSRVVHALTSMNCIGGSQSVNAARRTILVSKDHLTGAVSVTERSVQRLLLEPNRLDINPYLMPGDALACFDADISNIREVAKVFSDLLSPLAALSVIFGTF